METTTCEAMCIPPDKVALVWPHIRGLIHAAIERGGLSSFRPIEDRVLSGDALLWLAVAREGKLAKQPRTGVTTVILVSGPMRTVRGSSGGSDRTASNRMAQGLWIAPLRAGVFTRSGCHTRLRGPLFRGCGYAPLDWAHREDRGICARRGPQCHSHHGPQGLGARSRLHRTKRIVLEKDL